MPNFAKLTVVGHLGQDAEYKEFNGKEVANFSIAYNPYTKKGEEKRVIWISVKWWGVQPWAKERLWKGAMAFVSGELDVFAKKDGSQGIQLNAKEVTFLDKRPEDDASSAHRTVGRASNSSMPF